MKKKTRPDTRPPVADGWAGAEMRVFPLFDSSVTDQPTNQPTDGRTDKASYRDAWTHLKTRPYTRPSVADGWAGAELRVFPLFNSIIMDQRTDGKTDRRTDKASYTTKKDVVIF